MDCPHCGTELVAFRVPESYRGSVPGDRPGAGLCPHCLALAPVEDPPSGDPELSVVSDAIPAVSDAAVPLALSLGLLENLARNRAAIADLLEDVEAAGVDPLLVLDRLAADPSIDARADLRGRRRQLEQLR